MKLISLCPESIIPFDANGLYATVMSDISIMFPDINSYKFIENCNNLTIDDIASQYKHYIIECDIYIPKELKFIPISTKNESGSIVRYNTGSFKNQVYNDIDISEAR